MPSPHSAAESAAMLRDYWRESRRPLVSLVFISPLLLAYEIGILVQGPNSMRNGAEVWLRTILDWIGFGQYFLLPMLTVALLLGWHHVTHDRWYVPRQVLPGMAGECTSLALVLVLIAWIQGAIFSSIVPAGQGQVASSLEVAGVACSQSHELAISPLALTFPQWLSRAIGFFGAGIYEEVLFRLMLLTFLVSVFHLMDFSPLQSVWGGIVLSSVLFSLAHYVGPQGDDFTIFSFLFRFIAGGFFAVLFVKRGFGIAAGTHTLYDLIVGLV